MKTKKGFLNLEGGSHSIVTPGNKLDVTAPELKTGRNLEFIPVSIYPYAVVGSIPAILNCRLFDYIT
jgi:hypothetical protein